MVRNLILCFFLLSMGITACRSAPPKESARIGLILQDAAEGDQKSASQQVAGNATQADDARLSKESDGKKGEISGEDQNPVTIEKGLSASDQLSLLEVSRELNAIRKKIFLALDTISSMDTSNFSKTGLEIIDEIEGALAETRHYLDHEAELIYIIPYIKDAYFDDLVDNRLVGIVKTREIIHLYKTNLESLYKKLGKDSDVFSPDDTLKHFESSIEQLDKAYGILLSDGK
jgi:hypothetical protein